MSPEVSGRSFEGAIECDPAVRDRPRLVAARDRTATPSTELFTLYGALVERDEPTKGQEVKL